MIMQWKHQGQDYITNWQGIHFTLFEHPQTKRWELLSNGKHVRETWTTARRAMEMIDARQQALVMQAAKMTLHEARQALERGGQVNKETTFYPDGTCGTRYTKGGTHGPADA
jgi:hypothetical protein